MAPLLRRLPARADAAHHRRHELDEIGALLVRG
jgi:hypothetical protein